MSATTIHETSRDLNLPKRNWFMTSISVSGTPSIDARPESIVSAPASNESVVSINRRNRLTDFAAHSVAVFLLVCVSASCVALTAWGCYAVLTELATWNVSDFVNSVTGSLVG